MTIERTDVVWLEARGDYTLDELMEMSGLPRSVVDDLVACGALPIAHVGASLPSPSVRFAAESVVLARAAHRLREHFELEQRGLAVAVSLLRRVRNLERQMVRAGSTES